MLKTLIVVSVVCLVTVRAEQPHQVHNFMHPLDFLFSKISLDLSNFFNSIFDESVDVDKETKQPRHDVSSTEHTFIAITNESEYILVSGNETENILPAKNPSLKSYEGNVMDKDSAVSAAALVKDMCEYEQYHLLSWSNQILGLDYRLQLVVMTGLTIFFVFTIVFTIYLIVFLLHLCKNIRCASQRATNAKSLESLPTYSEACASVNPNSVAVAIQ